MANERTSYEYLVTAPQLTPQEKEAILKQHFPAIYRLWQGLPQMPIQSFLIVFSTEEKAMNAYEHWMKTTQPEGPDILDIMGEAEKEAEGAPPTAPTELDQLIDEIVGPTPVTPGGEPVREFGEFGEITPTGGGEKPLTPEEIQAILSNPSKKPEWEPAEGYAWVWDSNIGLWDQKAGRGAEPTPAVMTYEEAQAKLDQLGGRNKGYYIDYDEQTGGYRVDYDPSLIPAEPKEPTVHNLPTGQPETVWDDNGNEYRWNTKTGQYDLPTGRNAKSKVVSEGGYDWEILYDPEGNEISRRQVGTTEITYTLPEGQPQTIWDENGYEQRWNTKTGRYDTPTGNYDVTKNIGYQERLERDRVAYEKWLAEQDLTKEQIAEEKRRFEIQQATQTKEWESQVTQQTAALGLQREELLWRQTEAEKARQQQQQQYLAQLGAQPKSWLEYALASKGLPVVQPWQLPLAEEQYGFKIGQPIPGWQPEQAGLGLPELTTPSAQYQARMGPTAYQQYLGYQQAQSGAPPEETQWRLWQGAPPGGQYRGLSYQR